ncbi:hypothetical protein TNCV_1324481 [Trichonephila clavipes]|nr:hypothetical protein TNCV_1324481 [Trichonephila clavipes]
MTSSSFTCQPPAMKIGDLDLFGDHVPHRTFYSSTVLENVILGHALVVNGLSSGGVTAGVFCMTTHQHIDIHLSY